MERMLPCSFGFRHNELRIFGRGELVVHRDRIRLALVQLRVVTYEVMMHRFSLQVLIYDMRHGVRCANLTDVLDYSVQYI